MPNCTVCLSHVCHTFNLNIGRLDWRKTGSRLSDEPKPVKLLIATAQVADFGTADKGVLVQIRTGFELIYSFPQPTPIILLVNIHDSRAADIVVPDCLVTDPSLPFTGYRDAFGNQCNRGVAPAGRIRLSANCVINDSGEPDEVAVGAGQDSVENLPEEVLIFLRGSRYCETDILSETAWHLFSGVTPGYPRVQAICDYVHHRIAFNYQNARATRTAMEGFNERTGVCRDYAHLAIAFCRCMNIPARYCTGYLSDLGTLPPYGVGDFAAWFEAWIGGKWHTFDPRNNVPRVGRVLMARGRDACDVAIATTFGPNTLEGFTVWTDEFAACGPLVGGD